MKTKLKYGSLFSGVGGFDMGFDQENYECVFQVEWDKYCQKILAKHWPEVPKWSDVQDVNGAEIPPCDVLTFGSPCQDLSVAGKRAGLDGTKSSMFYEATRIIKEMRNATEFVYPRVVVWENVPGALSSNNGADFGAVIDTLADIGAVDIHWSVLDAQHFGVPQRRRRIFVVAIFDPATSSRCPDPLLPVIKGSRGDFAKGRKAQQNAARSAEAGVDAGGFDTEIGGDAVPTLDGFNNDGEPVNMPISELGPTLTTTFGPKNYSSHQEVMSGSVIPVAYSIREDAKNNNFSATETDVALCLNGLQPSTQSHHAQLFIAEPILFKPTGFADYNEGVGTLRTTESGASASHLVIAEPIIFENSFRDGPRIGDDICHTLPAKMGSGGGNTPMLVEPVMYDALNGTANTMPGTLRTNHASSGDFIAQPIFSFDTQFGSNAAVFENQSRTLKATQQSPSVTMPGLAVRRLTPLECERLMGWPDDHTRFYADGTEQADTHRYKQCGNGVATPVAKWIAKHLKKILLTSDNE